MYFVVSAANRGSFVSNSAVTKPVVGVFDLASNVSEGSPAFLGECLYY